MTLLFSFELCIFYLWMAFVTRIQISVPRTLNREYTMENNSLVLTFKVQSFRRIPNPYVKNDNGERTSAETYVLVADVMDVPDNIPMETNPRKQKMTTNVAKGIKESLLNTSEADFYLLNRGLLLSAKEVTYSNYSNEVTIVFEDSELHGNVDGGHTYKTILTYRDQLEPGQQFVRIEIVTGCEGIFQSLAAARNKSVQVQDQSIAELENRFEMIKRTLGNEPFMDRVFFQENDEGEIDVADLLALLNMFNIDRYRGLDSFPTNSYSTRKKCIEFYINEHKAHGESAENPYFKMVPIMPDIMRLYDAIECNMNRFYRIKNPNGKYGSTKGVQVPKNGQTYKSRFMQNPLEVASPAGFIYPILGAFRALLEEKDGVYTWKSNPFDVLERVGADLVESTVAQSRALGNNPQSVGKDTNIWKTLYMTVAMTLFA